MKIKEIRRYSSRVYDAVLRLLPQLNPEPGLPSKEHFRKILKSDYIHFFIAELDDSQIVGIFTLVTYVVPTGTKVWIEDVVVDESQRGRGFGREMMLYAIGYARSLGAKAVDLTSKPSRVAANHLYRKTGFLLRETNVYRYLLK